MTDKGLDGDVRDLAVSSVNTDFFNPFRGMGMIVGVVDGFYGFEL